MQLRHLAIVMVSLWACAPSPPRVEHPAPVPAPPDVVASADPEVDSLLAGLSTRDRIAQLVVPWIAGTYAAYDDDGFAQAEGWIDSLHVGGVIVSVGSPLDVAAKLNHLQRRSRLPLLVASDLEGGTSIRLVGGTPFPPNMGIGATGSDSAAYQVGRITALEGRAVGIQIGFAPVADVNNNAANPIINVRSFGESPREVSRFVVAEVRGLQDNGMVATVKHFPGHGDTDTDSHLALPVINADWARLDTVELVPFRAAVAAGVQVVMSAHVAMPRLDAGRHRPGTVVPEILTGVLRDSLGFHGLIVTDALNMAGVADLYGAEAGVRAFLAGADLLLQPADPRATIDAMETAVARGDIGPERLDRSVRRVLALKRSVGLFRQRTVPLDRIPDVVGDAGFRAVARDIAARSVVMVKDVGGTIHNLKRARPGLTLVTYAEEENRAVGLTLASELRSLGFTVSMARLWPSSGPASYDSAAVSIGRNPVTIFAAGGRPAAACGAVGLNPSLVALMEATSRARPAVLVSLGNPYLIAQVPVMGSYLIGWCSNAVTEQAVARALAGAAPITGRLPISIPPLYPRGWGVQRRIDP